MVLTRWLVGQQPWSLYLGGLPMMFVGLVFWFVGGWDELKEFSLGTLETVVVMYLSLAWLCEFYD